MSLNKEWILKMWYISTMVFYSAFKRKKTHNMKFSDKWMDLEKIILSEVVQT